MGLDMYLEVRKYVPTQDWIQENGDFVRKPVDEGVDLLERSGLATLASDEGYGVTVSAVAIYWRKANAIHNWFVQNCANGVDECQPIYVSRDQLIELRDLVVHVLAHRDEAEALLPPQSGFFFGSTEIDEWYWEDMEKTAEELNDLLIETFERPVSFVYQASW